MSFLWKPLRLFYNLYICRLIESILNCINIGFMVLIFLYIITWFLLYIILVIINLLERCIYFIFLCIITTRIFFKIKNIILYNFRIFLNIFWENMGWSYSSFFWRGIPENKSLHFFRLYLRFIFSFLTSIEKWHIKGEISFCSAL